MRDFKWSTTFHSSEESPIVPAWVSLPFLPIHYIICKEALYSIAATIGKPLRIDHATASVNRPTVARVLIEYDISRPLLKRLWIGEKDTSFWQYITFEKVSRYYATCKHVGHSDDTCYINKPELRNAARVGPVQQTVVPDGDGNKSKVPMKTPYVQKAENRNQNTATNEATTHSAQDTSTVASPVVHDVRTTNAETSEAPNGVTTTKATHVISSDPLVAAAVPPPSIVTLPSVVRASPKRTCTDLVPVVGKTDSGFSTPVVTAAGSMDTTSTPTDALGLLNSYFGPYMGMIGGGFSSRDAPYDDASLCTLNTQCTDFPVVSPVTNNSKHRIGKSHRIEDYSNSSDEFWGDDRCGNSDSKKMEDVVIEKLSGQRIIISTEGFTKITPRKGSKINRRRRRY